MEVRELYEHSRRAEGAGAELPMDESAVSGKISVVAVNAGDGVQAGQVLVEFK